MLWSRPQGDSLGMGMVLSGGAPAAWRGAGREQGAGGGAQHAAGLGGGADAPGGGGRAALPGGGAQRRPVGGDALPVLLLHSLQRQQLQVIGSVIESPAEAGVVLSFLLP